MTFVRKNNLEDVGSHNESDDGDQLPAFSVKPFQALLSAAPLDSAASFVLKIRDKFIHLGTGVFV